MRTRLHLLIPAMVTAVLLAGCGADADVEEIDADLERLDDDEAEDGEPIDADDADGDDDAGETTDGGDDLEVAIRDNVFVPEVLQVDVGDTVTWVHEGSRAHTVTSRDFDSMELSAGDVFAVTFDEAGTVPYECTIHQGMAGEIIVE